MNVTCFIESVGEISHFCNSFGNKTTIKNEVKLAITLRNNFWRFI